MYPVTWVLSCRDMSVWCGSAFRLGCGCAAEPGPKYCCWYACDALCRSSCVGGAEPHWGVVAEEEPDACPGPVLLPQRIQHN